MATFQVQATLILAAFVLYVFFNDQNVRDWVYVQSERLNISARVWWMRVKLHPRNPVTNYVQRKRIDKLIKELQKEESKVEK